MSLIVVPCFAIALAGKGHGQKRNQLIGNLGRDPELKEVGKGMQLLRLNLATTERYKGADGEWKEDTQWHTVVAWGKQAEALSARVKKGSGLMVEGRLVHRKYEKDGEPRYATEVVLAEYQVLADRSTAA
jgi:single-strand DNA-binding protein